MGWILLGDLSGLYTLFVAHVYLDTWLHLTGSSANGGSPEKLQVRDGSITPLKVLSMTIKIEVM